MTSLHASLSVALLVLASMLFGCSSSASSSNEAPVIDDVESPATAKIGASGNYELLLTVTCHDPDGVVSGVRVDIPGFTNQTFDVPDKQSFTKTPLSLQLDGHAAKGTLAYDFVILDGEGASATKSLSVTLQ